MRKDNELLILLPNLFKIRTEKMNTKLYIKSQTRKWIIANSTRQQGLLLQR